MYMYVYTYIYIASICIYICIYIYTYCFYMYIYVYIYYVIMQAEGKPRLGFRPIWPWSFRERRALGSKKAEILPLRV